MARIPESRRRRAWWVFLLAGALLGGGYFLLPAGSLAANVVYGALGLLAVAAIVAGVGRHHPRSRMAWLPIALGILSFVAGDLVWSFYELFLRVQVPYPSPADAFYLGGYPLVAAGLLAMVRSRSVGRDRAGFIDAAIIAVVGGVLSWAFLISPYALDGSSPLAERAVSVAYPLADVALLGVAARLAFVPGWRSAPGYMLAASLSLLLAADTVYAGAALAGTYQSGDAIDAGWLLSYTLLGATALHPAARSLTEPAPRSEGSELARWRLALLVGFALVAPALIFVRELLGARSIDVLVTSGAAVILFSLVLLRIEGLVLRLDAASSRYRHAAAQKEILRRAGEMLVSAQNRDAVYQTALRTALELTGEPEGTGAFVAAGPAQDLRVVAAAGAGAPRIPQARFDARGLLGCRLRDNRLLRSFDGGQYREAFGLEPAAGEVLAIPVFGTQEDEAATVLVAATPGRFSRSAREGLETLGAQVSLALESMALAEDLHRRESEARLGFLVENASDIIAILGPDKRVRYVSPSCEAILGYAPDDLMNASGFAPVHPEDAPRLRDHYARVFASPGVNPPREFRMRHADGSWRHMEVVANNLIDDPRIQGLVINARDITERKMLEERLSHQASHDSLTGLPNRALFTDRLEHALTLGSRGERSLAVMFLDLDDFKVVNDSLGHAAGDRLLKELAGRLSSCVRSSDTVARLGGDEFAVLLEEFPKEASNPSGEPEGGWTAAGAAIRVARRILEALETPFDLQEKEVRVRPSIGIVTSAGEKRAEDLLGNADVAMYTAKSRGKGRYEFYDPAMHAAALERLHLSEDLRGAVARGEFVVHYQPIVSLGGESGAEPRITEVEALVRWEHPDRGTISPASFIPLAEETGDIVQIGLVVLEESCRQVQRWRERDPQAAHLTLSVNLSARQFRQPNLAEQISGILERTGLPATFLKLEITESAAMEDVEAALAILRGLGELGVNLAVDDFGTGYSSLSHLSRFPVDTLKVDRSFVNRLEEDPESAAIISTTVTLARELGLSTTAEGVETAEQFARLREMGCDHAQGYYFARPMPPEEVPGFRWVTQWVSTPGPSGRT